MKSAKLLFVFVILAVGLVGGLWVSGFIGGESASELINRSVGLVVIAFLVLGGIAVILRGGNNASSGSGTSPGSDDRTGPKF